MQLLRSSTVVAADAACRSRHRHAHVHTSADRLLKRGSKRGSIPAHHGAASVCAAAATQATGNTSVQQHVQDSKLQRMRHLEDQALGTLQEAIASFERPVFPCALIAGDVVILHLLNRLQALASGRVAVIFVDTYHLFDETHTFLHELEEQYGFTAKEFHAAGVADVKGFREKYGSDLFLRDIEEYDRVCKVEPFNRALQELRTDCMINGRRRDHGFDRAHLETFEDGHPVKCNPLAYWEFRVSGTLPCSLFRTSHAELLPLAQQDCWNYIEANKLRTTVQVPKEKWFEYAGERSGRFQGLTDASGKPKTECGIHVAEDEESGMANIRG